MTAIDDILRERERQNGKWGEQNHELPIWLGILMEEVGEVAKEVNEYSATSFGVEADSYLRRYRTELIEVAAVAIAAIESLDRNELYNE